MGASMQSMVNAADRADKEAGETWRRHNPKPGADDYRTFVAEEKRFKAAWVAWFPEIWLDAHEQADEIADQKLSDKYHAEYVFDTWGKTVEEYNSWVESENKKQREHWTKPDFNKILRGMS